MLVFRLIPEGGFLVGDPSTDLAAFAFPSSPYAHLAATEPENMARLLLEMAEAEDRYWRKAGVADHMREAFFNRRKTLLAELLREDGARAAPAPSGPTKTEERKIMAKALNPEVQALLDKASAKAEADKVRAVVAETRRVLGIVKAVTASYVEEAVNAGDKVGAKMYKVLGAAITTAVKG
jgi:hypothetical protein